jgi:hypothetical protein
MASGAMENAYKRVDNYSSGHKRVLVELCSERIACIESKQTDARSAQKKQDAWNAILKSFVAKFGGGQDLAKLKGLWKRLKLNAKKEMRDYEHALKQTGGGPPPKDVSSLTHTIVQLIPREFTQMHNPFDDDATASAEEIDITHDER